MLNPTDFSKENIWKYLTYLSHLSYTVQILLVFYAVKNIFHFIFGTADFLFIVSSQMCTTKTSFTVLFSNKSNSVVCDLKNVYL